MKAAKLEIGIRSQESGVRRKEEEGRRKEEEGRSHNKCFYKYEMLPIGSNTTLIRFKIDNKICYCASG
ncbi:MULTISPECIES: hypothetical protein [unclassified Microcoleus]|uniref:hypothetical protein n=1 Tax=unclassified Microcoleus TaxID=2642155 RepID=UPI002FD628DE